MKKLLIPILLTVALLVSIGATPTARAADPEPSFRFSWIFKIKLDLKIEEQRRVLLEPSVIKGEVVMMETEVEETTTITRELIPELELGPEIWIPLSDWFSSE